jgi:hypothetical protein
MLNLFTIINSWLLKMVVAAPVLTLIAGVLMFIGICVFNWIPKYRKVANYYLSGKQQDEKQAFATAQGRLYGLNGVVVYLSGLLIIFSLAALGVW